MSGCARECAEAQSKDIGVIATENGWNLYVAGNGGFRPRHADLMLTDVDTETLVRTIDRFIMFYVRTADRLQRTASWLEGLEGGLDYLRAVIVEDSLGIADELDAAMARHVEAYEDEWAAVLDDPDRLRRFVSFVNAPETPDPSISFETEREQIKPVLLPLPGRRGESMSWVTICRFDELLPERGVAALVEGRQVAVFRSHDDALYAIDNQDPYTGAFVLSRGIVGTRGTTTTVASPLHKQVFDLATGACMDDDTTSVAVFPVRNQGGVVEVSAT